MAVAAQLPVGPGGMLAGVEQIVGNECAGVVVGHAHVFLGECLGIGTASLDEVEVRGLVHFLALIVGGELGLEFGQEALVERVLERHAVERKALGVSLMTDLLHEGVEEVAAAAVRAEDLRRSAPCDAGVGDGVEFARVGMQGELVQDAVAALAGLGVGIAGHAVQPQAVGHGQHVGAVAVVVDGALAEIIGTGLQDAGKRFAILQKEPGLDVIARADPGIQPRARQRLAAHQAVGRRPRPPDLAALLRDLEPRVVPHPCGLVGQQQRAGGGYVLRASHGATAGLPPPRSCGASRA